MDPHQPCEFYKNRIKTATCIITSFLYIYIFFLFLGQERFGNMTRVYYKEAVGAFIVFDVTRVGTFEAITKWKQDLDSKVQLPDGEKIPCVLLANKVSLLSYLFIYLFRERLWDWGNKVMASLPPLKYILKVIYTYLNTKCILYNLRKLILLDLATLRVACTQH